MILQDFLPSPSLRDFVRKHQVIRFQFCPTDIIPAKVYAPRPETCLVFYLRDLQDVVYLDSDRLALHPRCTLTGQHTVVTKRCIGRDFWAVQIVLQPSALYLLTGIPVSEITNKVIDAEAIWGSEIRATHEQMSNSNSIEEAICLAERFLERAINKARSPISGIDRISGLILNSTVGMSVDRLASEACLSSRQFHRKFTERIGIGPKLFDKVVRFEKAFFMKNANPQLDWLSIALACGYYDYQHLAKDYKYFTGMSPTGFYELDMQAPERAFGVVEVKKDLQGV